MTDATEPSTPPKSITRDELTDALEPLLRLLEIAPAHAGRRALAVCDMPGIRIEHGLIELTVVGPVVSNAVTRPVVVGLNPKTSEHATTVMVGVR